jgi:hypothetical protein
MLQFGNCIPRLVAPEDDPFRLKHVVLDITIKIVVLMVKLYMAIVYTQQDANLKKIAYLCVFLPLDLGDGSCICGKFVQACHNNCTSCIPNADFYVME